MIVELFVENLAIIEGSQVAFGPGFSVLTGETGAGKSLLIDAIELALGERADSELVRTGAPKATVNVVFDLSARPELRQAILDLGIALDESLLYVHREVFAEGRSQCRIGGKLTPVAQLRQLGRLLVDLHGQHDHQSLLDPERHLAYLDDWIGLPALAARERVAEAFRTYEDARRRLDGVRAGRRDREQRLDLLRYQVREIEGVEPVIGEMEELEAQQSRLKHAERLSRAAREALAAVVDDEGCVIDRLGDAIRGLEDVSRFDPSMESLLDPLRSALIELQETSHPLREYAENLDADPARLDEVADRIDALRRLRRKYGDSEAEILAFLESARRELELLTEDEGDEETLRFRLESAREDLERVARDLTQLRAGKATEFSDLVQSQLRDLAMDRARFRVEIRPRPCDSEGADAVEFFFSANLGEEPKPLAKIASGGEISRVMLAIKTALAGRAGVPTLIFDEVDAGLGGRAAATVARKIEELAAHYQVLVISHLPQIAGRASAHFRIEKTERNGRVATQVRPLHGEERTEEIARMLAGEQITESALANARELLGER